MCNEETIYCWACKTALVRGQNFCKECKNWQNWRRHTDFSAVLLSLLIAALSVSGLVAPTIKGLLSEEPIVLDASFAIERVCLRPPCTREDSERMTRISATVTNAGNTNVLLGKTMYCQSIFGGSPLPTDPELIVPELTTSGSSLVLPSRTVTIRYDYWVYNDDTSREIGFSKYIGCYVEIKSRENYYFYLRLSDLRDFTGPHVVELPFKPVAIDQVVAQIETEITR